MQTCLSGAACRHLPTLLNREWLVTNGIGGFASATVAGANTRRYHGLLFAALRPPVGRTLLVARLDESLAVDAVDHLLYSSAWKRGAIDPEGWKYITRWSLIDGVPTWTYQIAHAKLTKRIWMEPGRNVTYVQYHLLEAQHPLRLSARLLVNHRHYHYLAAADADSYEVHVSGEDMVVRRSGDTAGVRVSVERHPEVAVDWRPDHTWYHGFHLPTEERRGFDFVEDHLSAGVARMDLAPGGTATFVLAAEGEEPTDVPNARQRVVERGAELLERWEADAGSVAEQAPHAIRQLVLAADQFIVGRPAREEPEGHTIIAGYPWFTDWGRDTMIALPGLTLCTGRHDLARQILRTWGRYVDEGLIPNRFPDEGETPEYHTADATLWYLWAIDQYVRATGDVETLIELMPTMRSIVDWHQRGTRHNIHVAQDGLIWAGDEGVNLTWMDAKIGERVITPRMGKPVELNALWYDALCNLARLADLAELSGDEYQRLATRARHSFHRFWNHHTGCCRDVVDGPGGDDDSVRPNQIFAVSLAHSALPQDQQEAVVKVCTQQLTTWFGLRTLTPRHPHYCGRYAGGPVERDEAYHQGTAWGWLLGPLVVADFQLHHDARRSRQLLAPMLGQVWTHGVGSLSEVFDGDEPHAPGGCIAQAWSVAETLRAWHVTQSEEV